MAIRARDHEIINYIRILREFFNTYGQDKNMLNQRQLKILK